MTRARLPTPRAITAATVSQVRVCRAFGVRVVVLANELVDAAGLRWVSAELDADPNFELVCWVDSIRGVELLTAALSVKLTAMVRMSPIWRARWSLKKAREPFRHSELAL